MSAGLHCQWLGLDPSNGTFGQDTVNNYELKIDESLSWLNIQDRLCYATCDLAVVSAGFALDDKNCAELPCVPYTSTSMGESPDGSSDQ